MGYVEVGILGGTRGSMHDLHTSAGQRVCADPERGAAPEDNRGERPQRPEDVINLTPEERKQRRVVGRDHRLNELSTAQERHRRGRASQHDVTGTESLANRRDRRERKERVAQSARPVDQDSPGGRAQLRENGPMESSAPPDFSSI